MFDLVERAGERIAVHFRDGVLDHWSVWVHAAVELFQRCRAAHAASCVDADLLALANRVLDRNKAFFDVVDGFKGASPAGFCGEEACLKGFGVSTLMGA